MIIRLADPTWIDWAALVFVVVVLAVVVFLF